MDWIDLIAALLLLLSLVAVAWPFLFYPLILRLLPTKAERPVAGLAPSASLLFCAYNEAAAMPEKLANLAMLKVRCPALEILAFDDGSSDERSEEHTSELQSIMRNSYAVFCLKKKIYT